MLLVVIKTRSLFRELFDASRSYSPGQRPMEKDKENNAGIMPRINAELCRVMVTLCSVSASGRLGGEHNYASGYKKDRYADEVLYSLTDPSVMP
jgi:hypothetical protein